jgi:serine/threonine-protein kinase
MDLSSGTMVGEYEVTGRLGSGAMGVVYAAVHPVIGKKVAIKVLSAEMTRDDQVVKRFINEARAVNQIEHPNIVDIFSFGNLDDGTPYLVMPLLDGSTLGDILRDRVTISGDELVAILGPVAEALDAAHREGIVHRDLKPDNIFVIERAGGVEVRVLDFGVAKLLDSTVSSTAGPIGTPLYMAPEQCIANREVDGRADVYAFGVLAFHALTGRYPIEATSVVELVSVHLQELEPAHPSSFGVSRVLDAPILRCLAADPAERYPDVTSAFKALALAVGEMTDSSNPIEVEPVDPMTATVPSDSALGSGDGPSPVEAAASTTPGGSRRWLWAVGALALAGAGGLAYVVASGGGGKDDEAGQAAVIDAGAVTVTADARIATPVDAGSPDAEPPAPVDAAVRKRPPKRDPLRFDGQVPIRVGRMKAGRKAESLAMAAAISPVLRRAKWAARRKSSRGWILSGEVLHLENLPGSGRAKCTVRITARARRGRPRKSFTMNGALAPLGSGEQALLSARSGCVGGITAELVESRALPYIKKLSGK